MSAQGGAAAACRPLFTAAAALSFHSLCTRRGPLEQVCQRWHRIALQLPASLSINLCDSCSLGLDEQQMMAEVEQLLPHLSCRRIVELHITGCTCVLPAKLPNRLARALYPDLRM